MKQIFSDKSSILYFPSLLLSFLFLLLTSKVEVVIYAAAAESLQSCLTLCDPIDGSSSGSPVPGILQARVLEWGAIGISNFLEEISSLSHSVVFHYFFALIAEEGFLISPCYSLEFCIQMLIPFLFSFAFRFSSFHSYL